MTDPQWKNPGPNTRWCPGCKDNIFLPARVNPLFADGVNLASEYPEVELLCPLCGEKLGETKV